MMYVLGRAILVVLQSYSHYLPTPLNEGPSQGGILGLEMILFPLQASSSQRLDISSCVSI